METKQTNFSILMFPWLAHGHIFPYLELAKNLSKQNFNIFYCSTANNLASIRDALATSSDGVSIHLVQLQLPSLPDLPPEFDSTQNVPSNLMPKLHQAFQMSSSSFSTIITSLKPDMLIYDAFQPWAAKTASSLGIPAVHFATTGAAAYSFYYHLLAKGNSPFPYDAMYLRDYERRAFQSTVLSDMMDRDDQGHGFGHFSLSRDIVLMKTCRGIEGKYMDYLSVLCRKKLVAVGPLVAPATNEQNHSEIMRWLSEKNQSSTVYISFGSENYLSKNQKEELAKGLVASDVNFMWVVRFPPGEKGSVDEALQTGFLDRVGERGMIVQGWAPQTAILAHPSIGAFVSHCGMSSTIESVYFGVPIIGMPFKIDQPLNAKLMVEAGVGVEVMRDENGHFSGEEVANAIKKVVVETTGEEMRLKAAELSKKMKSEEEYAINEAAGQLRQLCMEHRQQKQHYSEDNQ